MITFHYYRDYSNNKFLISVKNNKITIKNELIHNCFKISKKEFTKFCRSCGGKIDINGGYYFTDETLAKDFIEQLNLLYKLK